MIDFVLQKTTDLFSWLWGLISGSLLWVLDALVYILKAVPYLILDGLLSSVYLFVSALDLSAVVFQWAAGYALIPPQAIYFIVAIGFPQFVTLVAGAYVVRFLLNLIPAVFTRV